MFSHFFFHQDQEWERFFLVTFFLFNYNKKKKKKKTCLNSPKFEQVIVEDHDLPDVEQLVTTYHDVDAMAE
jgi:hypothetical protein